MSTIAINETQAEPLVRKVSADRAQSPAFQHTRPNTSGTARGPRFTKRAKVLVISTLALASAAAGGWKFYDYERTWQTTDNAYVQGHVNQVSPPIAGTVTEVLVDENEIVRAGQPLVRLDPRDWITKRDQAKAAIVQADAQIQQANAQIAEAKSNRVRIDAQVSQSRAQADREKATQVKAHADYARAKNLFYDRGGVISRAELDTAKAGEDTAAASLAAAQSAVESTRAQVNATEASLQAAVATKEVAAAQKSAAQAELENAELQLSYTTITAPIAGRIGRKNVEVGNRIQPGQALFAIVQDDMWVVANFKETQLSELKLGQPVRLEVDAFPKHEFEGVVDSFSPASGAQFALLPPDNATGNFTKIVQRVPVKLRFDRATLGAYADRIVPGMSVNAKVKIRE